ncbi:MAG: 3-oxoacyl-ACP reductase FabG [Paenibacillaceae bacterium]|nr:3-oxoacyl-ACP reductase FabG [Paenibacillaceae bacterium]
MSRPAPVGTVLVTGGSRGIGAAVAERFAADGLTVVIHYREGRDAAEATAARCRELGATALTVAADIRSAAEIAHMRDMLDRAGNLPDILVNNAGIAHYGMLADLSEAEWDEVMDTNLKGLFLCTQAFMGAMVSRKYGRIVNVSSLWGIAGASCEVAYSAAKGGVNAFTKALALELAPSGVTVNAVAPGAVDTRMLAPLDADERGSLARDIPVGRIARPDEIASLVHYLAQPEAGYITGQVISPNGGWHT